MPFNYQDLNKALGSNVGQFGMNTLMGMFANKGKQDQLKEQQAQSLQQALMGDRLNRDSMYMQQAPTGWQQNYLQHNLAKNIAFQRLLNAPTLMPVNEGVKAKLEASGWKPFQPVISDEWAALDPYGARLSTEMLGNRERDLSMLAQGRNQQTDWTRLLGNSPQAQQMNAMNAAYTGGVRQDYANQMQQLQAQQQQQKKGGFWSKFGGILKAAAPIAASFIPGVGPLAAMAIGGIGSAVGNKLQGNSWKSSIGAGALGAGGAFLGNKFGNQFFTPKANPAATGQSFMNTLGKGMAGAFQSPGLNIGSSWQPQPQMQQQTMFNPLQSAIDGKLPPVSRPYQNLRFN